jgi:nucleotide-binding universal stress UspA family protein
MHQHILIATDGSSLAERAVSHGLDLARKLGARVTIVTATEPWSVLQMAHAAENGAAHPVETYEAAADKLARDVLERATHRAAQAEVACEVVHARGRHPAEAIVETAEERGCDLIVMASHGRTGLNKLLLGSQTARVLALTTTAVLVYR